MFNKLHVQQDPSAITFGSACLNKDTAMIQHPTTRTANTDGASSSSGSSSGSSSDSVSDLFSDWIDVLWVSVRQFKQIEFPAIPQRMCAAAERDDEAGVLASAKEFKEEFAGGIAKKTKRLQVYIHSY